MDRETIIQTLTKYEMYALDQRNRIAELRFQLERDRDGDALKIMDEFIRQNEALYLKIKEFAHEMQGIRTFNLHEEIGTTEEFPAHLENLGGNNWRFHLPPLYSISSKRRAYNEGKHIYYLVMNLLDSYEKENERIKKLENPLVIFRHHIASDVKHIYDFDNTDSKRALDAMQGFLLKDDSAINIRSCHEAVVSEEESYCEIFVIELGEIECIYVPEIAEIITRFSASHSTP